MNLTISIFPVFFTESQQRSASAPTSLSFHVTRPQSSSARATSTAPLV